MIIRRAALKAREGRHRDTCSSSRALALISPSSWGHDFPGATSVFDTASGFCTEFHSSYCIFTQHLNRTNQLQPKPSNQTKSLARIRPCDQVIFTSSWDLHGQPAELPTVIGMIAETFFMQPQLDSYTVSPQAILTPALL